MNNNNNPEFDLYLEDKFENRTAEDDGGTYKGILMACFCLSVASYYSQFRYHKFLFQDGMLEGGDNRKKELVIKTIKDLCTKYDLQYIVKTSNYVEAQFGTILEFKNIYCGVLQTGKVWVKADSVAIVIHQQRNA